MFNGLKNAFYLTVDGFFDMVKMFGNIASPIRQVTKVSWLAQLSVWLHDGTRAANNFEVSTLEFESCSGAVAK